jgi:acetyl esterase/lipase
MGSIESHRQLVANLSAASDAPVLNVSYRLGPEHPYPAAVEDAMAAYRFALSTGLDPTSVAIAGDSAGGGLTVACLVALRNAGDPLPAAGVCISPWFDLTLTSESMRSKADVDPMVDHRKLSMLAEAYLAGTDPKTPTASPLFADLTDLPPLLVHVGTREVLLDDSTRFCERARSAGVDVELAIWEEMFHVWHAFADLLPEGHEAIDEIGGYLTRRFT